MKLIFPDFYRRCNIFLALPQLSAENLKRMWQSMVPPSPSCMQSLYEDGFNDAVQFLEREAWTSSQSDPLVKKDRR